MAAVTNMACLAVLGWPKAGEVALYFLELGWPPAPPCAQFRVDSPDGRFRTRTQARVPQFHPGRGGDCALQIEDLGRPNARHIGVFSVTWSQTIDSVRWTDGGTVRVERSSWPHPKNSPVAYIARRLVDRPKHRVTSECKLVKRTEGEHFEKEVKLEGGRDRARRFEVACRTK